MANKRYAGTLYIKVNSEMIPLDGSWEIGLGTPKREGQTGPSGHAGYIENPQVPYIEGDAKTMPGLDLIALANVTDATVTAELANGDTYMLSEAWQAGDGTISTGDGKIKLRFEGALMEKV